MYDCLGSRGGWGETPGLAVTKAFDYRAFDLFLKTLLRVLPFRNILIA
jgi:hypothetical protein